MRDLVAPVVELQDDDVALAAVDAWMRQQIQDDVSASLLTSRVRLSN